MDLQPHQSLSKLEAATRQLHLALDLFFKDADPIGVHTLAGAARQILLDLLARTSDEDGAGALEPSIENASRRLVEKNIAEAKNFLKHADHDPNRILRFHANWTDFLMFDAIRVHIQLARTITGPNACFLLWLSAKYPDVLILDTFLPAAPLSELRRTFPSLGSPSAQKRKFRVAMTRRRSRNVDLAAEPHADH